MRVSTGTIGAVAMRVGPRAVVASVVFGIGLAVAAPDARFTSVRSGSESGAWEVMVVATGKVARTPEALTFRADAVPVPAELVGRDGDAIRFQLTGAPASFEKLTVERPGRKGAERIAAVTLREGGASSAPSDDLVIYHVMIGMFRNGNRANDGEIKGWKHPNFAGGDLQGVIEALHHVRSVGANAIWLSPVFASRSSHGYDVTNYYRIADQWAVPDDPVSSLALFRRLVTQAHEKGLAIILDLPLNHASKAYELPEGDPEGLRPRSSGPIQQAEKTWESWGGNYRYWSFDSEPTRRFLKDVALHWLRDEHVDGLRLDYVRGVPREFWAELRAEVSKEAPGAFLVGECWIDDGSPEANAAEIATYYDEIAGRGRPFASLLDFPMQDALTAVFARGEAASLLEERLQADEAMYPSGSRPAYFLDNHDMARFAAWTSDRDRLVAAVTFMASLSGPIVLYYGTETGLVGGAAKGGFTDVGRVPMPWSSLDDALVARVRAALEARAAHPALRRGGRRPILAGERTLVMAKVAPEETAIVGVNLGPEPIEVAFALSGLGVDPDSLHAVVGGGAHRLSEDGRTVHWTVPAKTTAILVGAR